MVKSNAHFMAVASTSEPARLASIRVRRRLPYIPPKSRKDGYAQHCTTVRA